MRLALLAEKNPDCILPVADDFRAAMIALFPDEADWYSSYGSACPERFLHDESIGYQYLGSGLNLSSALRSNQPLFLCPAESHQGACEHCHIFPHPRQGWSGCVESNEEMIRELEYVLACVNSGQFCYSEQAIRTMRDELAKRRSLLR